MKMRSFLVLAIFMVLAALAVAQTDEPAKPMRLRISSGVAQGSKIHDVQPKYPKEARERGITGDVLLQATIDTKGNIINLKAVQGDPILVKASIDAVKKWRYRPYKLKGEPVEVETTIKIQFHM
jgi:periplasmic protein TonB